MYAGIYRSICRKGKKMKDSIKEYKVIWEIDVSADSPLQAAIEARQCQMPGTTALYFKVTEIQNGKESLVHLPNDPLEIV